MEGFNKKDLQLQCETVKRVGWSQLATLPFVLNRNETAKYDPHSLWQDGHRISALVLAIFFDMQTFKLLLKTTQLFAMRGSDDGCSDMSRQGVRQGRCLLDELVEKCQMNSINIGVVFNWSGRAMGFSGPVSNDVKHQLENHVYKTISMAFC